MIKNGTQHIASLRDGRQVYLNGQPVGDVTAHAAFRNSIRSYASLYDYQARDENVEKMTFVSPDSGNRVSRIWQLPTSYDELVERRAALEAWSELHYGFMGRSPDHVASCLSGMFMGADVFEQYDPARAGALRDYYRHARDNDLFLTYVIVNPQGNQSKSAHEQEDKYLAVGIVDQDAEGITVRGAKMLATSGIMANEVFCSCIQPLRGRRDVRAVVRGADEREGHEDPVAQVVRGERDVGVRQPAVEPLRRERRGAVFRRREGAVGADLRRRQHRDVREAVPRDARARVPELPMPGAADDEAALPRRNRVEDLRGQRHEYVPAGARNAGPARGRSVDGRGVGLRDGSEGHRRQRFLRARPQHAVRLAGRHAAALFEGAQHAARSSPAAE